MSQKPTPATLNLTKHLSASELPRSYVVIPARKHSTRLKNKMLLCETGKSLLQHTYEAATGSKHATDVIVATDHDDIFQEVQRFGGRVMMTSPACASGTDRVAEVARQLPDAKIIVNVQGDEPELAADAIDQTIRLLANTPTASMATLCTPIRSAQQLHDPSCVKVVFDEQGRAMYFSRSPIPFVRDPLEDTSSLFNEETPLFHQHIGLYAYRRDFLLQLETQTRSSLEVAENLEQLRVLQMGETIAIGVTNEHASGIDTPSDYAAFVQRWNHRQAA